MADFEVLANAVIDCNIARVLELTQKAVDEGAKPIDIINQGLIAGMNVVGQRFKKGDMYVPEVLMAAKAMNDGMSIVKPLLLEGDMPKAGKVLLGTVAGDLHDIGKNLVGMMMESGGLVVVDMGVDISPEKFVEAIREHKPDVLGLSALLTTTMLVMKDTIEVLVEEGLRDQVKIIVGGAPVTQDFADEIGADGWAPDAASAKDLVLELTGK
jgi:5-methyltetrahydrofolate--homocysteine methyltransferase